MQTKRHIESARTRRSAAAGAMALVGLFALPVSAQTPSGIACVLAPGVVILDAKGGIYFTDPGPRPVVPGRIAYVYYLPPGAKQPIVIDDKIARPNGLTLTRDGKTLIVDDTLNPTVYAYDVEPDGSVKNKRTFAQLRDIPEGKESVADGMAPDRTGRDSTTTFTRVHAFTTT